jgi:mRNA interferase MazF
MKRGDIVTVAMKGDYGKPRPALIIQSNLFDEHPSTTVLPITSELRDAPIFRITVTPNKCNGLQKLSQVMVDKTMAIPREKCSEMVQRTACGISVFDYRHAGRIDVRDWRIAVRPPQEGAEGNAGGHSWPVRGASPAFSISGPRIVTPNLPRKPGLREKVFRFRMDISPLIYSF